MGQFNKILFGFVGRGEGGGGGGGGKGQSMLLLHVCKNYPKEARGDKFLIEVERCFIYIYIYDKFLIEVERCFC